MKKEDIYLGHPFVFYIYIYIYYKVVINRHLHKYLLCFFQTSYTATCFEHKA